MLYVIKTFDVALQGFDILYSQYYHPYIPLRQSLLLSKIPDRPATSGKISIKLFRLFALQP